MKKSSKEKDLVSAQGALPILISQPAGPETMPAGFTSSIETCAQARAAPIAPTITIGIGLNIG